MKIVKQMPAKLAPQYASKYDQLLDGKVYLIEENDFPNTSWDSVQQSLYSRGKHKGVKVMVRRRPEGMYVQAVAR